MSQPETPEPTNRPKPGEAPRPLVYSVAIEFHPPIQLVRKKGLEFAGKLQSHVEVRTFELKDDKWTFSLPLGPEAESQFTITVMDSHLQMEAIHPSDREELEFFETRYALILKDFQGLFEPKFLLNSAALLRATLQIDGDARLFIAEHVAGFDRTRLSPLGRPVHLFGIRLFMPPFRATEDVKKRGKGKAAPKKKVVAEVDWSVDVKAESLLQDPTKLFLEAESQWPEPRPWNVEATEEVVGRLAMVSEFLKKQLIPFLTYES